jgi:hypothetical protein
LASIPEIVDVEVLRGRDAGHDDVPAFLVEVPHGADERRHYDRLRSRLQGALPDELHAFFHINTDVGAVSPAGSPVRAFGRTQVQLFF